jgi:phosphatidylglycerophosphate synthase
MEQHISDSSSSASGEPRPNAWSYFGTKLRARPATSKRILTWPNAVTALRMPFIPAMVMAGLERRDGLMVAFAAGNYALDMLDGHLARLLDQASRFGALFDKVLDAISMISAVAMLAYRGTYPLWLFAIIAVKYVILFSLGTWLTRRKCDYPQVYSIPRIRLGFGAPTVAGIVCGAVLPWPASRAIAQWATATLLVLSTAIFVVAAVRARPRSPEPTARAN